MNATQQTTPVRPRVDTPTACRCGQDLDRCSAQHCPRCGTQLGAILCGPTGLWWAA